MRARIADGVVRFAVLEGAQRGKMMERVLVTGGAGFIGSHTVDLALENGYKVRILDNLQPRVHPGGKPNYIPSDVEFIVGDVRNHKDMVRALEGVQYVFHWNGS